MGNAGRFNRCMDTLRREAERIPVFPVSQYRRIKGNVTISEWVRQFIAPDHAVSEDEISHILWERTAFPFCGFGRHLAYQVRSALRASKNKINPHCDMCNGKYPYHDRDCGYVAVVKINRIDSRLWDR